MSKEPRGRAKQTVSPLQSKTIFASYRRAAEVGEMVVRDGGLSDEGGRQGVGQRIMVCELLLRRVDMMVIWEDRHGAQVRLRTPLPPAWIGGAPESGVRRTPHHGPFFGPNGRPRRGADPRQVYDDHADTDLFSYFGNR